MLEVEAMIQPEGRVLAARALKSNVQVRDPSESMCRNINIHYSDIWGRFCDTFVLLHLKKRQIGCDVAYKAEQLGSVNS